VSAVLIRPLTRADGAAFRTLRLEGLRLAPEAFGSAYEDEILRDEEDLVRRIPEAPPSAIFGAFEGEVLVGVAGLLVPAGRKERHKGMICGASTSPRPAAGGAWRSGCWTR
jgi:hypothetical protein